MRKHSLAIIEEDNSKEKIILLLIKNKRRKMIIMREEVIREGQLEKMEMQDTIKNAILRKYRTLCSRLLVQKENS